MKNLSSNLIVLTLLLIPFMMIAQTTHTIEVGPGMIYTPNELTIEEGDIVSWVSLGGTHDVNFNINSVSGRVLWKPVEIVDASLPVQVLAKWGLLLLIMQAHTTMIVQLDLMLQWEWLVQLCQHLTNQQQL